MNVEKKPENAIDLSHHLSDVSRARATSPLKGLARFFGRPGLISLAGGEQQQYVFGTDSKVLCIKYARYACGGLLPFRRHFGGQ